MVRRSKFGSVSCQVEKRKSSKGTRPNKSQSLGFNIPAPVLDSESVAVAAKALSGKHELITMAINARVAEINLREDSIDVHFLTKYLIFDDIDVDKTSFSPTDDKNALCPLLEKLYLSFL